MVSKRIRLGIVAAPVLILLVPEKRNEYDHVRPSLTRPCLTRHPANAKAYD